MNWFISLNPILQAFTATLFTWSITILGASIVLFFKKINKNLMDTMLGIAGGVMLSAAFFSLIYPSLELAEKLYMKPIWLVTLCGFMVGGLLLFIGDKFFEYFEKKHKKKSSMKRVIMLISSITLHNIPEGMVIGVAFGSVLYHIDGVTILSAILLAIGIGLQNFPEGTAVSLPLRREGYSRKKAFLIGSLTGIVEPISGVLGALLVLKIRTLLPFLLAFAGGAMIYVVVEEIVPESQTNKRKDLMALFTLIGFSLMMVLDVAFN